MSHFTVLVALRESDDLESIFAPYYEGREDITPYKQHEGKTVEDWPLNHIVSLRDPDSEGYDPEAPDPSDLQAVAAYLNSKWDEGYDVDDEGLFTWSTYNPDSKWDWYQVGGRWAGKFSIKSDASPIDFSMGELSWGWDVGADDPRFANKADVAKKRAIDFEAMRDVARKEANERWDQYEAAVADYGPLPESFMDLDRTSEEFAAAREAYWQNATVVALREVIGFMAFPTEEFAGTRADYVQRAANGVVPGFAYLDHNGWIEPGKMGWFGMSSDTPESRDEYNAKINQIIDELPDDVTLVNVDCHI